MPQITHFEKLSTCSGGNLWWFYSKWIVNEIVNGSKCKPSKLWVDRGREYYNNLMQKRLNDDILM